MLENHTSAEIAEMQASWLIDPWGERAGDIRAATVGLATVRGFGEGVSSDEFMPPFDEYDVPQEETPEQMRKKLRAAIGEHRFVDLRG